MPKVTLRVEDMQTLLATAKQNDKLEYWADIAMEWMGIASAEIYRLNQRLKEEGED